MDNRTRCVISGNGLGSGSGLASSVPMIGEQFGQTAVRVRADAFEEAAQIGERIEVKSFAAGSHTPYLSDCRPFS